MISVRSRLLADGWICEVEIEVPAGRTHHTVTVTRGDLERWGRGDDVDDLVRRSFEFLLEREPPSSILRRFELSVIERYFPEFGSVIRPGSD